MKRRILSIFLIIIITFALIAPASDTALAARSARDVTRYTVLILDTTGQYTITPDWFTTVTVGSPLDKVKEAACKFVEEVLSAEGINYVALVTCTDASQVVSDFTGDVRALTNTINNLPEKYSGSAAGFSNFNEALELADGLLQNANRPDTIRNILFFSGCLPAAGDHSDYGHYTDPAFSYYHSFYVMATGIMVYAHANVVYETAERLKSSGYNIYTLGCFTNLDQQPESFRFAKQVMNDIQSRGFYDAESPEDLIYEIGEAAKEIIKPDIKGFFEYSGTHHEGTMETEEFLYYDDMFNHAATKYDHDLATMSLEIAMAAFGTNRRADSQGNDLPYGTDEEQAANVIALLGNDPNADDPRMRGLGFQDVTAVNYRPTPTTNSIAAVFGHKTIYNSGGEYELVIIAVRGGEYKAEWGGDFLIGTGGTHESFETAKDYVVSRFSDYIDAEGLLDNENVKLWITGYSRGAAVANLVSAAMNDSASSSPFVLGRPNSSSAAQYTRETSWKISKDNIYSYCFATPMSKIPGYKSTFPFIDIYAFVNFQTEYGNIFNVVNPSDIVSRVAPASWGYARYGVTKELPSSLGTHKGYKFKQLEKDMLDQFTGDFDVLSGYRPDWYLIDDFRFHQGNINGFEGKLYDVGPYECIDISMDVFFDQLFCPFLFDVVFKSRNNYVNNYQKTMVDQITAAQSFALTQVAGVLKKPIQDAVTDEFLWRAMSGGAVASTLVSIVPADSDRNIPITINSKDFNNKSITPSQSKAQVTNNAAALMQGHFPELYLAWMRSLPADYFGGVARRNPVYYRIVHINCPVNIEVYDEDGLLLGTIVDNVPQELADEGISLSFDENGQKILYLPADSGYTIKVVATDAGTMTFSIAEYSRDFGMNTRLVNYYDIPLEAGDVFEANLDAVNDDLTPTSYELSGPFGIIAPDEDLAEDNVAIYSVKLEVEGNGFAVGGGLSYKGEYTNLSATPEQGESFLGWYEGGSLVTAEPEYRFSVRSDAVMVARFTENTQRQPIVPTVTVTPPPTISPGPGPGSVVPRQSGGVPAAAIVIIVLFIIIAVAVVLITSTSKSRQAANATGPARLGQGPGRVGYPPRQQGYPPVQQGYPTPDRNGYYPPGMTGNDINYAEQQSRAGAEVLTGTLKGTTLVFTDGAPAYLGKDPLSHIAFTDDYINVSRKHCTIAYDRVSNMYTVTDTSTNGTYSDGNKRLVKGMPTQVPPNSVIMLASEKCSVLLK
ncbi:MAG: VWA domain-containing protein [Oscillospiraceae bacterium]|nr:VWA domain-containing protein [Oscillospiraceae bacterium]